MTKILFFLFVTCLLLIGMSQVTVDSYLVTLDWFDPASAQRQVRGAPRVSDEELQEIKLLMQANLDMLRTLRNAMMFVGVSLLLWIVIRIWNSKWSIKKYDGLGLVIFTLGLCALHFVVTVFSNFFEGAHNATLDLRVFTMVGLFIAVPILFYTAYRTNRLEIQRQLHNQRWITVLSLIFALVTSGITITLGTMLLFTPSLGGNIS